MQYGLIGEKLGHSYSAEIHRAFGAYDYELVSLPPEKLGAFLTHGDFCGLNVTIPYKKVVIPFCAALSETARKIGSVNTIRRQPDGTLYGDNTDYAGFAAMAHRAGIGFAGKRVAILGTGGTSLTAQAVVSDAGAAEMTVVSRTGAVTYAHLNRAAQAEVLINTTPVGMYPGNDGIPVSLDQFPQCTAVLDVIYNPLRTRLLSEAAERGMPYAGGLYMLTAQAAKAYEMFCGRSLPDNKLESVYQMLSASVCNVVLVGMPGCGKTTIGRMLAERMNRTLVDLDAEIEARAGMTVPALFERYGEPAFRKLEAEAAAEAGKKKGLVIACGGGTILTAENRAALRQNGRVYWLQRPVEQLETAGRPLSAGQTALRAMLEYRSPLYALACDVAVANNGSPAETAEQILEEFYEASGH